MSESRDWKFGLFENSCAASRMDWWDLILNKSSTAGYTPHREVKIANINERDWHKLNECNENLRHG